MSKKKNKKKNKKVVEGDQELTVKVDKKMIARIMAGALAVLLVLGTLTATIMYLFEAGHVH